MHARHYWFSYMLKISQSTGELVLVDVLVLRNVFEGAVLPRAARRPPEKALLLEQAATTRKTISIPEMEVVV